MLAVGRFLRMAKLEIVTCNIAKGRLEAGESQYVITQHCNVHRSTVSRIFHLRNRTVTATQTASSIPGLRRISAQTVPNRFLEVKLN